MDTTSAGVPRTGLGKGSAPFLSQNFSKIGFTVMHFRAFLRILKCLKLKLTKSTRAMLLHSRRETARCHCKFLSMIRQQHDKQEAIAIADRTASQQTI